MSDKQTTMSNDTLQVEKIVCLRNSRIAVTVLKKIYVDEAKHWLFLESIFIDQATLNGTRPNSPSGVKPARPLVGRYFMVQFRECQWVQLPRICSLVVGSQPQPL